MKNIFILSLTLIGIFSSNILLADEETCNSHTTEQQLLEHLK